MRSTYILPCIMTMISNFTILFIFHILILNFFFNKNNRFLHFHMIPAALLLITYFFLIRINYLHCVLSSGFIKLIYAIFTTIYIILIFMLSNEDIVDIEKPDGICLPEFVTDEFSGLYLHPSIIFIKQLRFV